MAEMSTYSQNAECRYKKYPLTHLFPRQKVRKERSQWGEIPLRWDNTIWSHIRSFRGGYLPYRL